MRRQVRRLATSTMKCQSKMDDGSRTKPKATSLVGVNIPKLRIHDENIRRNGRGVKNIPGSRPRKESSSSSASAKALALAPAPVPAPRRRQPTTSSSSSSFLDAIQKGETVTMHIGGRDRKSDDCNCDGCVPPIEDFKNIHDDEDHDTLDGKQDNSDDETESEDDDDILFRKLPSRNFVVSSSKVVQANSNSSTSSSRSKNINKNTSSGSALKPASGSAPTTSFKKLSISTRNPKRTSVTIPPRRFDLVDTDDEEDKETNKNEEEDDGSDYNDSVYNDNEEDSDSNTSSDSSFQNTPPPTVSPTASRPKKSAIGTTTMDNLTRATEIINLVDSDSSEDDTSGSDLSFPGGDSSFDSSSSSSIEIIATKPAPKIPKAIPNVRSNHLKHSKKIGQNNRESMTQSTFREFNTEVFGGKLSSVEVIWSKKLNTTAGQTRLLKASSSEFLNVPPARLAKVELSTKVIDDQTKLRTTLLHELIHAAVWILEGVSRPPHGKEFKRWAALAMRKIKDVEVTTTHSYEINYRYAWACTNSSCSFIVKRHSKSVDTKKHLCGRCKSRLIEVDPNSSTGTSAAPKKQQKPSAYNVFVKNQSKTVRQDLIQEQVSRGIKNPNVAQSDVMKECARRWRDHKQQQTK